MPLLKLWNSIRGRNTSAAPLAGASPDPTAEHENEPKSQRQAGGTPNKPAGHRRSAKGGRLGLFGGSGPHAALQKLVKPLSVGTVLEIAVGDGSRAIAILQTLGDSRPVRYVAIDQFEMSGGDVTLKSFHQTMRTAGIRPQVFPEPIDRGLMRVVNTVGLIDLVVIAADAGDWQTPETLAMLNRVTHSESIVLYQDEDSWERYEPVRPRAVRRAA